MADSDFGMGYALGADSNNCCNNGGNGGMFGNEGWWAIILFAMIFGWGRNGFGGGNGGGDGMSYIPYLANSGALTRGELCQDMNFQSLENGVRGIQQGLCDGFYAMNTGMLNGFNTLGNAICNLGYEQASLANNTNTTIMQGFNASNIAQLQGQNALQSQIAGCCCDLRESIQGVNYNMATNTCTLQNTMNNNTRDIIDSQNAGTRAILDYLCKEKINDLQSENQSLRLAASQANQNSVIRAAIDASTAEIIRRTGNDCPIPAYWVNAPTPVPVPCNSGCGYNNNCGFGCGC